MSDSEEERDYQKDFEEALHADMMVNTMVRIAKDLERVIVGIFASAGLLGLIAGILIVRWMIEGH